MTAKKAVLSALVAGFCAWSAIASAEVSEIRISKGYGMSYLPLVIMQEKKLLEGRHC
jgi:NitT/TauT family transport system substrate-binding protein